MKSLTQQFADWVRTKPAEEEYCYLSNGGCAFALFLIDSGICTKPSVGGGDWRDDGGQYHILPARVDSAVLKRPRTFGALASRLEQSNA